VLQWQQANAADSLVSTDIVEDSAIEISNQLIEQMALFNRQLDSLETQFGPFDQTLLEPLQSLAELAIEAGDFDEADRILRRRLQLIRIVDGPDSPSQLLTLAELIRNDIRRSQWQQVTANFENIHLIQSRNAEADTATVLEARNAVSAWHFTAIYLDDPRQRARHFRDASEIQRQLPDLAEAEFGEESLALVPWVYQVALEWFRVVAFFEAKDELASQARSTMVRLQSEREGLSQVKRIRQIIESKDDPEAEAMAMIYEGDFAMLLEMGTAPRLYRDAMEKLEAAGISKEKIEAFFARPVVLPEAEFHFSVDEALAAQSAYGYTFESGGEDNDDVIHLGDFIAWNESLPYARRPEIPELASSVNRELYVVELQFSIDSIGNVRIPKVQQAEPDTTRVRRNAIDAIEDMQFRPEFANGRGYRTRNVTMRYFYPPPL